MCNHLNKNANKANTRGFTLIELIIVIAVIGILAAILIPRFIGFIDKSNLAVCLENRGSLEKQYLYLVEDGAPGVGAANAIGPVNATLTNEDLRQYFEANSHEDFTYNDLICPKSGIITGKLENDGTKAGKLMLSCSIHTDVFFHSSFNAMTQVKTLMGGWNTVDGKLVSTTSGENRAIFNGTSGKDYTIKMNAVYLNGSASGYGVYYRATDAAAISGYCFQYDPGAGKSFTIRKVTAGREAAAFQTVNMASVMGAGFNVTAPHDIEIKVVGTSHIIKVDGKEVMNFTDSTFTEGNVGLRTWSGNKFEVNEVIIQK